LLIDAGPSTTWPVLREKIKGLPPTERRIDLLIITHIDQDHIGGVFPLLENAAMLGLSVGEVWFNGVEHLPPIQGLARSVAEGQRLGQLLLDLQTKQSLLWNSSFLGQAVATPHHAGYRQALGIEAPLVTVLSPTPKALQRLAATWTAPTDRSVPSDENHELTKISGAWFTEIHELAQTRTKEDVSAANGSSIAFVLEHRGTRCLFTGDASPRILGAGLTAYANANGALPLFDVVQLPHHGSAANSTQPLLSVCPAINYLVSTDGSKYGHPHEIAIARVLQAAAGREHAIWFNYPHAFLEYWSQESAYGRFGSRIEFLRDGSGVEIVVPSR
jgi:hypothetical protein